MKIKNLFSAIALYAATCFPPFGGMKGGCQNIAISASGNLPDASAMLDITATDKGLLIPRVALASATTTVTIASPATSLLVYNDGSLFPPAGYYYNSGTPAIPNWVQLATAGVGGGWSLSGNSGLVDPTNFLGTTAAAGDKPLNFRVNNEKAGRISNGGPTFLGYRAGNSNTATEIAGIGFEALYSNTTGQQNTAIGVWALYSNTTGIYNIASGNYALWSNTTASRNTAIGWRALNTQSYSNGVWNSDNVAVGFNALYSNQPTATTNGIQNTAVGNFALYSNSTGSKNTALGYQALHDNTTGSYNTAIGEKALYTNVIGSHNIAIGVGALGLSTPGDFNVAVGDSALAFSAGQKSTVIGYQAGQFGTASGSVFIGYNVGSFVSAASNTLMIDNSSTTTPLIFGNFALDRIGINDNAPAATLSVGGTAKLGIQGTVLNKVIKGTVSIDPPSIPAASTASVTAAVANAATASSVMVSPSVPLDPGVGIAYARISAAGTVEITFINATGAPVDPATQDFYITVVE